MYRPVAVLIVQRDLIVFIMNLIITQHHFGGQNQDHVYSPVCLIGHFGHNRVSFRTLPTLVNNNYNLMFCFTVKNESAVPTPYVVSM